MQEVITIIIVLLDRYQLSVPENASVVLMFQISGSGAWITSWRLHFKYFIFCFAVYKPLVCSIGEFRLAYHLQLLSVSLFPLIIMMMLIMITTVTLIIIINRPNPSRIHMRRYKRYT